MSHLEPRLCYDPGVLGLTWSELGLVTLLFLLVSVVGYLPALGNLIGDIVHGYQRGDGSSPGPKRDG